MDIKFDFYNNSMKNQVVCLICNQYGYDEKEYELYFSQFYDEDYQKNAILIVALDNTKVIGFQSFFYWPYCLNGEDITVYQSGNSIVDPNYRGKGLFRGMLSFANMNIDTFKVDYLIGFPVEASYKSFIKDNWENPLNLKWYIKLINPLSVIFPANKNRLKDMFFDSKVVDTTKNNQSIKLSDDRQFVDWRVKYQKNKIYYFTFEQGDNFYQFGLKLNIRKKVIKELIIGEVNYKTYNQKLFELALKKCLEEVKRLNFITFVSIAINPNVKPILNALKEINFKETNKKIYFIYKSINNNRKVDFSKMELYRGDIDTW